MAIHEVPAAFLFIKHLLADYGISGHTIAFIYDIAEVNLISMFMRRKCAYQSSIFTTVLLLLFTGTFSKAFSADPVEGRWDIVIDSNGKSLPSWLEIEHSGIETLVGRFVYAGGSARPISVINTVNGKYTFSIPPQWEKSKRPGG